MLKVAADVIECMTEAGEQDTHRLTGAAAAIGEALKAVVRTAQSAYVYR